MKLDELLVCLKKVNIGLRRSGSELIIIGDPETLNASLISELRAHKTGMLTLIGEDGDTWWSRPVTITPEMLPLARLTAEEIEGIVEAVPGGAANVQDIYPLAPLQEGMLFHHLMGGETDPYIEGSMYSFDSRERLGNYLEAMQSVIDRHDILRTGVVWEGLSEPVQVVWRKAILPIEEVTLEAGAGDGAGQLRARYNRRSYRMDVRQAPMLRVVIAHDEEKGRWLMLKLMHHLGGDHTTGEIMQEEIQAYLLGQGDRLTAPLPFRNLVAQARLGISQEEHEVFFRRLLGDVEEPTAPFGLLNVQGDGTGIKHAGMNVDVRLARRIRESARKLGVSAASLCHVAWALVVARTSGREDVVFGTLLFGRMQGGEGADRAMGLFMNTLPVRIRVGEDGAEESVRGAHKQLAELLRHEHASLSLAQRCSAVPAPAPLFSALLNYRHSPGAERTRSEDTVRAWEGIQSLYGEVSNNYPLTMNFDDLGEVFRLSTLVEASVDAKRVCQYMHTALESLVEALESEPTRPMCALEVAPEAERRQVLYEWNETQREYSREKLVHELFEDQVDKSPEAVAVVFEDTTLSYGELNRRANQLAHYLRGLGVVPDARVGICVERSLEMIVGLLAVMKAGGAYVPLDPDYPVERLQYMVTDSEPVAVLTRGQKPMLFAGGQGPAVLDLGQEKGAWRAEAESNPDVGQVGLRREHLAYVIYTSGSTGLAKGVMVEHQQLVNYVAAISEKLELGQGWAYGLVSTFAADLGNTVLFPSLLRRGKLHVLAAQESMDGERLGRYCLERGIDCVKITPTHFQALLGEGGEQERIPSKCVVFGGETLTKELVARVRTLRSGCRIYNHYGPTECTVGALSDEVTAGNGAGSKGAVALGRPLGNMRVYVLDSRRKEVPAGVVGEIYIGGGGVARGYLNRAEQTAERFVSDPFVVDGQERMYKTGDLGRWKVDGRIEFLGRNDFQVKIRGYRIELGEIEARLAEHDGVREAIVIAREDTVGDRRLVAYYKGAEANGGGSEGIGAEELRRHLLAKLPEYMAPAAYVRLEKLPLTPNGKVDRRALPMPEGDAYGARSYEEPQGEIETVLSGIWVELLKLERVGRHDNFFELGGNSLLVVRVIARMRRAGFEVDVRALFATPVLAELAVAIRPQIDTIEVPPNRIPPGCEAITPEMLPLARLTAEEIEGIVEAVPGGAANVQDIYPLAPLQEGILFHHLMGGESDPYILGSMYSFDSRERLGNYLEAMQSVIDRHDILRTGVVWEGLSEPVQVVWRKAILPIEEVTLEAGAGDGAGQLRARYNRRSYRMDVQQAPLLRVATAHDEEKGRWLMLRLRHHLIGDHITLEVMQEEIQAYLLGQGDRLTAPLPFRNLVAQARLGISQEEHEVFFRRLLGDVEEPTAPFGLLNVQGDGTGIEQTHLKVEAQLARRIRESARKMGVSPASLCHVAWAQVMARVSGREDVVFGTVLFGRMQGGEGADRAMGLFMNTLPVRIRVGEEGAEESVRGAHKQLAELMRHEHASLALAQRCSAVPAPTPLFSAILNYRHSGVAAQGRSEERARAWEGIEDLYGESHSNYPLNFAVTDLGEGFRLWAHAEASMGAKRVCQYMHTALESLVEALESEPTRPMCALEVAPEAERRQVLYEWNETQTEYSREKLVHELFEDQVDKSPEAVAVVFEDTTLSYGELNRRANQLAHYLRGLGVVPDARVGICVERSLEMIVGLLAVMKAGGAYVPLDPDYPVERLQYMVTDSEPVAVLTRGQKPMLFAGGQGPAVLDLGQEKGAWRAEAESNPDVGQVGLRREHLAYVIYTSGSTGLAKGVMVEHQQLVNYVAAISEKLELGQGWAYGLVSTFAADLGNTVLFPSLLRRGKLHVLAAQESMDGERLGRYCLERGIDCVKITPTHFQALLGEGGEQERIPSKCVVFGGETLTKELVARVRTLRSGCRIYNHYGPTECTVGALSDEVAAGNGAGSKGAVALGRPLGNMRVYVLDSRRKEVPAGVVGEIYIGGGGVARGYLNRAEQTAERFVSDPFVVDGQERMYKTGDLGRWKVDGRIEFLGRNDFQVKIRGYRIELGEIEARLTEHDGVREAVVIAREDGDGDQQLVAYVVPEKASAYPLLQILRMEQTGELSPAAQYELPNGLLISHQNKGETEYLYQEIFGREAYLQHGITLGEDACIFDVGANIGMFTLFALQHSPGASIYAFEPIPPVFENLRINSILSGGNVRLFDCGLSNVSGTASFAWFKHNSLISGRYADLEEEEATINAFIKNQKTGEDLSEETLKKLIRERLEYEQFTRPLRTVSQVISAEGIEHIDLLKIDVQKSELEVLEGIELKDWPKIRQVVVEVHDIEGRLSKLKGLLDEHGYQQSVQQDELLETTNQYTIYARRIGEGDQGCVFPSTMSRTAPTYWSSSQLATGLRRHIAAKLPEYMAPATYVWLEKLPLTPNGKVDRRALPMPEGDAYGARSYEEPQGEIETVLSGIWVELLKLERVGRRDNFFELGGNSLLVVRVIARMRRAGFEVDVRALFTKPVLAELAVAIRPQIDTIEVPPNRIPLGCEAITPEMLPLARLTAEEIERIVEAVPGGAANVQDIYPLAPLQEGILFHHLMGGESDPYILGSLDSFDSRERLGNYLEAMQSVIDRHDILRTGVVWEGLSEPVQVVWRKAVLPVEEVTLEAGAGDGAVQLYSRYNPRSYQMDVRQAPLLRVAIAHDEEKGRWLMMLLRHHLASDHTTLEVMQEEIQAYLLGQGDRLTAPLPFRNLVAQARLGISQEEHEAFFRRLLGDVEEPTAPFGLLNVQGDGTGIEQVRIKLEAQLARRIRESARKLGVSPASLCHVAWAQVVARTSGREDVVFGTVLLGRMQGGEGADRALGLFMNTLPVRIRVGEEGAEESVRGAHKQLAELMRHEHASLALAQRCSGVPAPTPLFSALLNYRHIPDAEGARSEEEARASEGIQGLYGHQRTNYPLTLNFDDLGEGFRVKAQVDASVDANRVCQYMRTALESLVEALESEPMRPVRTLEVVPEAERRQIVNEWNATEAEYPREKLMHELFEEQVEKTPEAVAVVFEDTTLSYGELNRRANQLGHHLRELGVGPDVRVGICMERGLEMMVGLLGVMKAGGAYIPLDPAYPVERLGYMLEDTAPAVLLTQGRWQELFSGVSEKLPALNLDEAAPAWRQQPETNPEWNASGGGSEHLAYLIYTSGSTGVPKGAMVEQKGMLNHLYIMTRDLQLTGQDVVAQTASQCFDISVWQFLAALIVGGKVLIVGEEEVHDPEGLLGILDRRGVTVWETVPSMLEAMVGEGRESGVRLESMRWVVVTGEACPVGLCRRWKSIHPAIAMMNAYGPAECSDDVTFYAMQKGWSGEEAKLVPIGRPLMNLQVYVLDSRGEAAPVGVSGELYIGGEGVGRGYWNRAELTAERFVADGYGRLEGGRLYRTGDVARWGRDRNLEFMGRIDHQIKIRGYRIELGEIEARLAEHDGVREAVVIAREDTVGDRRLVAYYTRAEANGGGSEEIGAEELRRHLLAKLPEYMAPAAYVRLEKLPLTPNGKVDRKALPAPETDAYAMSRYEEPEGETERALAKIWVELLKLERVGRRDNFFELGGHSLLVVRVIARMRQIGLEVDVRALFATPVLAELAAAAGRSINLVKVPPNRIPELKDGETWGSHSFTITPEMLPLVRLTVEEIERIVKVVPGGAANVQDIYPLAPLQEGMLFHHLMGGEGDPYLVASEYSFDTRQRLESYLVAMQAVIDRHDILRTGVVWEGLPEPVQVVWRKAVLPVEEVTLEAGASDGASQLRARCNPQSYRMDVREAPLLRVAIAHDEEKGRWLMMLLRHHLAVDHTTLKVMQEEIQAYLLGRGDRLTAPLPFRNLVAQARLGISQEEHEAFFRRLLGDVEEPTAPFGLLNVQGDGTGIELAHMKVETGLARRIRERARKLGVTPASLCHVAWAQVVARTSGREDVVFGTVLFGRIQGGEGAERAMGLFINTLPVRIRMGEHGVEDGVRVTHKQLAELMRHEHASLSLAQRCSAVPAPAPLFSAILNYRHGAGAGQARSEDTARAWEGIQTLHGESRTNYPVTLSVDDLREGFQMTAQVEASVDAKRVCQYMHTALESLVGALESNPARLLRTLDVLPEWECRQVVEWNETGVDHPQDKCLHQLFEAQVEQTPDAIALVFEADTLTYEELNTRANRLAHYLRALGVGPDVLVGLCLDRSLEMMAAILAVLKAGGAYMPLDPAYPRDRLDFMLQDSKVAILLTERRLVEEVGHLDMGYSSDASDLECREVCLEAIEADLARESAENPVSGVLPENAAYVIYTSGSTGRPKGVIISHRAINNHMFWLSEHFDIKPTDCFLQKTAFSFDAAGTEFYGPLLTGGKLIIARPGGQQDSAYLVRTVAEHDVTVLQGVPSLLRILLDEPGFAKCHSLRRMISAGEALPAELQERFRACLNAELHNFYGPTEAAIDVTFWPHQHADGRAIVPIGSPIANTKIYLLDSELQLAPLDVCGELYIGGKNLARSYLNRPEATAERFIPNLFSQEPGERLYKTGDRGKWLPDGTIEILGRNDFQVKVRGYRIELGEIEARLADHDAVREAVVIAREDMVGDRRLVAYYTGAEANGEGTEGIGAEQLRRHLLARLPEYMLPAAYVRLEKLPLTPNGKVDRKALPAPGGYAYGARDYEEPIGEIETALAKIWIEILGVERVGRRDNFFELGGNSLLVMRAISRMRQAGFEVDVRALFTTPALAELAAGIGQETILVEVPPNRVPSGCQVITPEMLSLVQLTVEEIERIVKVVPGGAVNVQDIYPLAPLQEGMLFHHLMGDENDPYVLGSMYSFDSRERLESYLEAMQAVIDRHDILRTGMVWEGLSEPVQVVWRKAVLQVEELTLEAGAGDGVVQLRARYNPRSYRMDVRQAPMLPVAIACDEEKGRWLMMLLQHHLIGDHVTLEVMQEEIEAHLMGREDRLPTPLPFRNLVAQARLGVSQEEHEVFFRRLLGDVEEPTAPFGLLNVQGDGTGIKQAQMKVEAGLARRIRERARKLGVSPASLCHVAWAHVVARTSGREDVVFGTVLLGRMQGGEGADRALGLFMNTLPVRIRVGEEGAEESVRGAHKQLAELMRHEHASLSLAQRCSAVPAPTPLFSVLLNYRHSPGLTQTRSEEKARAWEGIQDLYGEARTNYPLLFSVDDLGEGFHLTTQVEASIDAKRVCLYMHTALESLVEALESEPARPMRRLEMLSALERQEVLYEWNETKAAGQNDKCIHELFEEQAERIPDAAAVVFGDAFLTYGELNREANRLAHYLRGLGVKLDIRVGICVERSLEMVVGLLAVLKAGGAYVPLDPAYPVERLEFMLEDSAPAVLLTQRDLQSLFPKLHEDLAVIDLKDDLEWKEKSETNPNRSDVGLGAENLAYLIYTSGSTGAPKGVMVEHRQLSNYLVWADEEYYREAGSGSPAVHSIGFDGLITTLFGPIIAGQRLTLLSKGTEMESIAQLCSSDSSPYTLVKVTPSHLKLLNGMIPSDSRKAPTRALMIGGEALVPADVDFWQERFPEVRLINHFGPTETTVGCCTFEIARRVGESSSIPIGRPTRNMRMYILDKQGEPAPVGVAGEIYIGGAQVTRGYRKRPELTAERYVLDPHTREAGARMYRTGDLGRWQADGKIEFLGRNDFQVKIRGYRIELGEIEAQLAAHEAIQDAVVIACEDATGDKRLVAYYTRREGTEARAAAMGAEELRGYLKERLPDYMVPAAYVRLEKLPLTANGKLDRKGLPLPDGAAYAVGRYEEPQGEVETILATIWAEALKVERVGRYDNFFNLGGHSLLVVKIIELLRRAGLQADVHTLFTTPVLAELAAAVDLPTDIVEIPPNQIPEIVVREESLEAIEISI